MDLYKKFRPDASERRLVLAFDYVNTSHANRAAALRAAQGIVARDMAPGDGIMIVALTDRLRIEQRFSGSPRAALETLQRMELDASLFARNFQSITPRGFLGNLGVLYSELGQHDHAIAFLQQARTLSQEIGDKLREGPLLGNLGDVLMKAHLLDDAEVVCRQAITICDAHYPVAAGAF